MDVSRHSRPGGLPDIHPQIDPFRRVQLAQDPLHALRQVHHFVGRLYRQLLQFIQMSEGHDHHVPGGVRIGIEDDVAVLAAMDNAGLGVIPSLAANRRRRSRKSCQCRPRRRSARESRDSP